MEGLTEASSKGPVLDYRDGAFDGFLQVGRRMLGMVST